MVEGYKVGGNGFFPTLFQKVMHRLSLGWVYLYCLVGLISINLNYT